MEEALVVLVLVVEEVGLLVVASLVVVVGEVACSLVEAVVVGVDLQVVVVAIGWLAVLLPTRARAIVVVTVAIMIVVIVLMISWHN